MSMIFNIIRKAGTLIGKRKTLNFIEGSNVTLTVADNSANDRVDITIASTGGGGGGDTILKGTASGTDTYTSTISGVTAYNDGDAYLIRFTNGNTTGCTLDINSLGAKDLYQNNDGLLIGGDIESGAEMFCIYNSTLNGFQLIGTSPNTLLAYVTNDDSVTITKGQPVYAFSGTGDRLTVKLASNTADATSAQTVGLVLSTSIAANQKGYIIINGLLSNLSTLPTSTFADGDAIYLGATAGTITNVKPSAPNHLVYLGFCTTASAGSAGRMYVRVQNGYEFDELHDVKIATPLNNQGVFYNTSNSLWENKAVVSALSGTKSEFDTACSDGNFVFVGDAILNPEGWNVIVKSANQTMNNLQLVDDTELKFSVVAGGKYTMELNIIYSGNSTAADYGQRLRISAGTFTGQGQNQGIITGGGTLGLTAISANSTTFTSATSNSAVQIINILNRIDILFSFTASQNATVIYTAGVATLTPLSTATTWKGSILKYKRLD